MHPTPELRVVQVPIEELREYRNNCKLHPSSQIDQIATSINDFGFNSPILAWHNDDGEPEIVAGHGRLMAARQLGMKELPVIFLDHLTDEQRRAMILIDNQLTMNSGFDLQLLNEELDAIVDINMEDYGFNLSDMTSDVSVDDFGEDFELPDGDGPEFKYVSLTLTHEQFEYFSGVLDTIDVEDGEGSVATRKICEVFRQWEALRT